MTKVLVTGSNGFVGKHLLDELLANGYEILAIGGRQLSDIVNDRVEYKALDLTDIKEVEKLNFSKIDSVIHLAGLAAVGPSFDDPMGYISANIGMECNLYEIARKQNVHPRFLIISSGSLYDPSSGLPLNEDSAVKPLSPYSVSKLGQEQLAEYYEGQGFEYIIARPFNHCGPGQGPGFLVSDLARQLVDCEKNKGNEVTVGNIKTKRDYTDVRDIVRAYRLLLEKGESHKVYNVCSGKAHSGQEILDTLMSFANKRPKIVVDQDKFRPTDIDSIFGDNSYLSNTTGWQPQIELKQTLADVMDYWRSME